MHIERLKARYNSTVDIPENITETQASRMIVEMQRTAPITYRQHEALERYGIALDKIPSTAREASTLLTALARPSRCNTPTGSASRFAARAPRTTSFPRPTRIVLSNLF